MQLFENIQKIVQLSGGKTKVSVSPAFSVILTNKTNDTIFLYPKQSAKVGYPLLKGETLEIENLPETSEFYTTIVDQDMDNEKGLYILCRPYIETSSGKVENNVVINNSENN